MTGPDEPSVDVDAAIAIVRREAACDARTAAKLIRDRAKALGVSFDEAASEVVRISGRAQRSENVRSWLLPDAPAHPTEEQR